MGYKHNSKILLLNFMTLKTTPTTTSFQKIRGREEKRREGKKKGGETIFKTLSFVVIHNMRSYHHNCNLWVARKPRKNF